MSSAVAAVRGAVLAPPRLLARVGALLPGNNRLRLVLALVTLVALFAGWSWFRDSPFVAVEQVKVKGAGGDRALVKALEARALEMSTLNVDAERLAEVAAGFPAVESVRADASFPHEMTVTVTMRDPAGFMRGPDGKVAIAADGTPLSGVEIGDGLVKLPLSDGVLSGEPSSSDRAILKVLGAAPSEFAALISNSFIADEGGPVVVLGAGIELRFGDGSRARAKWLAAAAVLADPGLTSVSYIDLSVPARPAAGGAPAPVEPLAPAPQTTPETVSPAPVEPQPEP